MTIIFNLLCFVLFKQKQNEQQHQELFSFKHCLKNISENDLLTDVATVSCYLVTTKNCTIKTTLLDVVGNRNAPCC